MKDMRILVPVLALAFAAPVFAQAVKPQPPGMKPPPAQQDAAPQEMDRMFTGWDVDHNNALSRQEFLNGWRMLREYNESTVETRLRQQFDKVDANHDGAIGAGEYANLLLVRQAGKSAPPLSTFDASRDQRLQFQEYLELVQRMTAEAAARAKTPGP